MTERGWSMRERIETAIAIAIIVAGIVFVALGVAGII